MSHKEQHILISVLPHLKGFKVKHSGMQVSDENECLQ